MSYELIAFLWVICGIVAAGGLVAHFQGSFPFTAQEYYRRDLGASLFLGLICGPGALLASIFLTGFYEHGWTLRRPK